jgi:death-on-curing protein
MAERIYLTLAEALEMHRQLIEEFGGSPGLCDQGRLEAAMFRPQIGYYNSLAEEAAALMESFANNHAFVDGNKRISFAVTDTFLRVNGFYLDVDSAAAYKFISQAITRGRFRFGVILEWILSNMKPLSD